MTDHYLIESLERLERRRCANTYAPSNVVPFAEFIARRLSHEPLPSRDVLSGIGEDRALLLRCQAEGRRYWRKVLRPRN